MRFAFIKCHGSGNDFPLIDARALDLSDGEWASVARALSDRAGPVGSDGVLLLTAGGGDCAFGMRMFNADGSEAETCLNGLRCVARAGFEALGVDAARVRLKVSTASVARVDALAPGVVTVQTRAGPASTDPVDVGLRVAAPVIDAAIAGLPSDRRFTAVAMPNPHLVSFVERVDEAELVTLGQWCEAGPALLADRANVSFVELRDDGLFVRTFERGVGLTDACGSAMAASVYAAGLTGRVAFGREIVVRNPGGFVRGTATAPQAGAVVTIAGNATFEWDGAIDIDLATGAPGPLTITRRRDDEVAAWAAVAVPASASASASASA
ncbi:diaminopimelate epimerase [Sphingomonas donggukensis]|uniref:Diaminopimelate epimerase n=1 Tax=Sphingomonas donggukensis TaxID=2949093 RepID=A0ABY4TV67_9SPHN|nr:diaminopimelate epimerase [Sphingomonas donggukensis]URW75064.1 diaminopimelate epimerase [Sphingomonas donggukensis]